MAVEDTGLKRLRPLGYIKKVDIQVQCTFVHLSPCTSNIELDENKF